MPRKKLSDEERYQMLKQTGGKGKAKDQAYKAKRERIVSSVKKKKEMNVFDKATQKFHKAQKSNVDYVMDTLKRGWKKAQPVKALKESARMATGVKALDKASKLGQKMIKGTAENMAEGLEYGLGRKLTPEQQRQHDSFNSAATKKELRKKKLREIIKKKRKSPMPRKEIPKKKKFIPKKKYYVPKKRKLKPILEMPKKKYFPKKKKKEFTRYA